MREQIKQELENKFHSCVVEDLISSYEELVCKYGIGDFEAALTKAGRFVEHTLLAIESLRSEAAPSEIKSVAKKIGELENDTTLDDSFRLLIPRVLYGMVYGIRNKRDAVHVKEIDPTRIDVALCVNAAGWVLAELVRISRKSDSILVEKYMLALSRSNVPFVEKINGETFVGRATSARTEVLLLLANSYPDGLTRTEIGQMSKYSPSAITNTLKYLVDSLQRYIHSDANRRYFITSSGEAYLAKEIASSHSKLNS